MTPLLRVFPRKTSFTPNDAYAFIGDPPLFMPPGDEVHVSVTFTWDIKEGQRLREAWAQYYPVVKIGGPAVGRSDDEFVPGRYVKEGVTFTSRGCNNRCPWCLVPASEGKLREIDSFCRGHIIQDNNLLQTSRQHINQVLNMLYDCRKPAVFSGGLQASLIDNWFVARLRPLHLDCLFLAADNANALQPLERALKLLSIFDRRKLRVYCMIGLNETIEEATERLETVWELGGLPFAQLYQPPSRYIHYPPEWRDLVRTWSRPAAMYALHKER